MRCGHGRLLPPLSLISMTLCAPEEGSPQFLDHAASRAILNVQKILQTHNHSTRLYVSCFNTENESDTRRYPTPQKASCLRGGVPICRAGRLCRASQGYRSQGE